MRRFRFSLEKILSLRLREEEQVKSAWKSALAIVNAIEGERREQERIRRDGFRALLMERSAGSMNVQKILVLEAGMDRLVEEIGRTQSRLKDARIAAEQARLLFAEAKRNRERIEKIKERHRRRYEARMRLEEMKGLDEVAKVRFLQKQEEGDPICERRS